MRHDDPMTKAEQEVEILAALAEPILGECTERLELAGLDDLHRAHALVNAGIEQLAGADLCAEHLVEQLEIAREAIGEFADEIRREAH